MIQPARPSSAGLSRGPDRWLPVAVPVVLVGLSAVLGLLWLAEPNRIFFDETYYVNDARSYLQVLVEESFAVHPPVGKWLIAAGIALFGDDGFGWRVAGAAEASLGVLFTYLAGRRLFRRLWPAALAGLLLAADGLWIAQSQIAMLDIHLAFFVTLGAWLVLVDCDRRRAGRSSWWVRSLAGVAFGLAVATKWSGALALAAAGLLLFVWELARRRQQQDDPDRPAPLWPALRALTGPLVLLPVVVYALSWVPWLVGFPDSSQADEACGRDDVAACEFDLARRVVGLVDHHVEVARFHLSLDATHNYRAPAYTWPIMGRPVVYYWETCDRSTEAAPTEDGATTTPEPCTVPTGQAGEILNVGNPALWWTFLPITALLAAGLGRGDPRAGFIGTFWGLQSLPWLLVSRPAFFFYMVPVVPFMALGVAYGALALEERHPLLRPLAYAIGAGGLGLAAGFGLEELGVLARPGAHWIGLGVGWLLGAVAAGRADRGRPVGLQRPGARRRGLGRIAAAVVAAAAVALLVYFYPIWVGLPLDEQAIRARWWFSGWI